MSKIDEIVAKLRLEPHPEGGFYRETLRTTDRIAGRLLGGDYGGERSLCTAIYYLLTGESFSAMHRVRSGEMLHAYAGGPVELLLLYPDGTGEVVVMGGDISGGERPQRYVEPGTWFGMRVVGGGEYALLGATVSPGFEFEDFELGEREGLVEGYPGWSDLIVALTR